MFKENKYSKCYFMLVDKVSQENRVKRKRNDKISPYYESHHILPKSMGGLNDLSNLILLTPREHYIFHLLLTKMCIQKTHEMKMIHAFKLLAKIADTAMSSRMHAAYKQSFSDSEETKQKMRLSQQSRPAITEESRRKRSESLTGRKLSEDHKVNLSKSNKGVKRNSDVRKEQIREFMKNRPVKQETKDKLSAANTGKKRPWSALNGQKSKGCKRVYREDGTFFYKNA